MDSILYELLTALGVGFIIGTERGWNERDRDEGDRIGGIRTFTLASLLGAVSGELTPVTTSWFPAAALLAFALLVAASYRESAEETDDIGITTSLSLLLTFGLGLWASFGFLLYSIITAVVVVAFLGYKPVLHKWTNRLDVQEIYGGIKLLIISFLILPLLPDKGFGPYEALNPYWLWWMVILITGLSFIGYVSIKYFGDKIGVLLTAFTGGLASSTAVTLSLAEIARKARVTKLLMSGVVIASIIMLIRVLLEVLVVNAGLIELLWIPLLVMGLVSITGIGVLLVIQQASDDAETSLELTNPFQIGMALKFAILLAAVLVLSEAMQVWFGDSGIYVLSFISGLMDVDPITLSLAKMAQSTLSAEVATRGIVIAVFCNTVVKAGLFAFIAGFKHSWQLLVIMIMSGLAGLFTTYLIF